MKFKASFTRAGDDGLRYGVVTGEEPGIGFNIKPNGDITVYDAGQELMYSRGHEWNPGRFNERDSAIQAAILECVHTG